MGPVRSVVVLSHPHSGDQNGEIAKRSWVKIGQVRTLSVERLGKKLAQVAPEEIDQIIQGLNEIIAR